MNKIFKVVWSKTKECYVVVSEVAKNNGGKKKVLATVFAALVATGSMLPDYVDAANNTSGGGVSSADASIAIGSGWGNSAYANTNFSIAIGDQSNANGKAAIALGRQAKTNGEEAAIAIGNQTEATSKDSTAVGSGSKSSGEYAAALGFQTKATANYATAIGSGARGYAEDSQAIGREAETSAGAFRAIAIGTLSKSSANYATSLGSSAEASAERAIAVGYKSTAKAESAISVGNLANAGNTDSIAVGNGSAATANYAVAVGSGSAVSGLNGVAVGKNSQATGQSAAAFGDSAQATNAQATAIGNQAVASDTRTTAIGNQAKATGPNATVVGSVSEGTGPGATAIGTNNKAGYESAAVGLSNTVSGNTSAAFGRSNTVTGKESLAAGVRSTASGEHNVAIGYQAATDGKATVAIGEGSKADIADGVALGSNSATTAAAGVQGFNPADSRTNTYSGLTGTAQTSTLGAVAVGNGATATRQITGLAAGKEDTDAVNVAQLRAVNLKYAGNSGNSDVRLENGTLNIKGEGLLSTSADGTGITVKLTKGDDIAKDNGKAKEPTNNGVATTQNVVQAINNSYWKATAGGNTDGTPTVGNVKPGTQVTYSAGDNLKVKQTINNTTGDQEYKYSLNPVLTGITSIANTTAGPKMTFGGNSINITGGSLDMGTNKITNLAPGTADNDAVNVKQLKDTELHITPGTYTPDANKKVKLTYTNGNNTVVTGKEAVIDLSGLATGGTASTESVVKKAAATGDTNIADVSVAGGKAVNDPGAQYEVSVSKNAVKDAAREAVTVNNGGNTDNPISVTPTQDNTNHNTTYAVTFDGNKAAKQIPLTYKATNGTTTTADQTVKLDKGLNFTGGDYTTASVGADGKVTFDVNLGTAPTVTDGKPGVPGQAGATGKDGIATVKTVVDTINNSGWKANAKANGGKLDGSSTATVVKPGDQVNFAAGKNLTVKQDLTGEHTYTYSLNKDLKDLTSVEIGGSTIKTDGDHITITSPDTNPGATPGATVTNKVANLGDEKHIKPDTYAVANDGSVTLKYVDGNGKDLTETTKITGIAKKAKVINGKNTTVEEGTDTSDNSVTYKVNVKGDLADISSITNGTGSGKISFEGDQVVKVGGDHPISFDGKGGYVTGLQNKDWDITNPTVVSGRAATEDQLKKVSDGFNNTVKLTGNSGATGTQKLNQNGGLSFGVVGADNGKYITTTASGSNVVADLSTDAKNKLNSKVVVAGSGAATVAAPTVTTNPDGSTVTTYTVHVDPATATAASTESVVKKAVTGDTNIADVSVADGKATGDVGAKYEVSVSRNAVKDAAREAVTVNNGGTTTGGTYTADTNNPITVNPVKDDTNHNTTYEVKFDGNKAAKQIPLTYKANGNGAKTVTLDKGLDFTNGTNTTAVIGNDGVVKYNLNKDVDLSNTGSLTVGDTKVTNGGVTITAPAGGTTSNVTLTQSGLDNGGNKIINVAPGTLSSTSTDAVNGSQLYTVDQKFNNKINLGADGSTETTKFALDNTGGIKFNIKGDGSGASGANQYISTTANGSNVNVDLTADAKAKLNKTYTVSSGSTNVTVTPTTTGDNTDFKITVASTGTTTSSSWNLATDKVSATEGTVAAGSAATQNIADTKTVTMQAGKNLTVKQTNDGTGNASVAYSLDKDISVETVTVTGQNGKDGKIGIDGKDGVDGKDGKNRVEITVEKGAKGVDGTDGHDGVNGHNGKDGMTRIVYEDKGGKQEVATLNDGMKYAGDDAQGTDKTKVIAKKLNETLDIIGGANKTDLTTDNIGVNNDGNGKLLVQLSKNLKGINTIKNGNTTITLNDAPSTTTPAVTITGGNLSLGDGTTNNKIVNVAPGTDDTDAVNVKQLKDAKTVLADGKNTKKSGTGTAADPYKVNVEGDLTEITSITNKADASGNNAGKITFSPNQTVTVSGDHNISLNGKTGDITGLTNTTIPTTAGSDFATKGRAATEEQLKSVHDTLKANERHIAPTTVAAGSTETKGGTANAGGTANVYKYDAASKTVTLTYNDGNGNAVTDTKAVIDLSNLSTGGTGASSWNIASDKVSATEGAVATGSAGTQNIADGKTVTMKAGKNLTVNQSNDGAGNASVAFSLDKNLENLDKVVVNGNDGATGQAGVSIVGPKGANGVDGNDGKVGIAGKDGKDAVSISGKDGVGHIGLQGPKGTPGTPGAPATPGANLDITTDHGTQTLVKPEANNNNKSERIVYVPKDASGNPLKDTDGNDIKREVATMDDGLKFTGNNESTENKQKLGSLVKVQGEGTKESTAVDPATGKKYVVLSDGTTKFESAKDNIAVEADGTDTLTVKLNKNLKGLNSIQLGGNTIQSNGDNITFTTNGGTTKTVATTDQLWTIQANGTDVPAKAGKVNLVAGDHITITPDAANGKMTISATGFGSMDGFNVKTSAESATVGTHAGDTTENIKNGKTVDMQAGKNLVVTQTNDGNGNTTVNYALNKDVDLGTNGSLKAGDTTVNKDGVTIANGPSITKTGVDAGDKKITNVADGDVNATSKDAVNGSQLKKYTDAAKTTVEAGDNNVKVDTDTTAADGHTNYKVSLKPVVTIGDTHKVKIDGQTGDITGLTNVDLTDPTFATKGRAATEEQLNKVLTEAKKKAVEKVQAGTAAAGDTNIATVAPKAGDTFGAAGATYEVSVSKNAVKDAAKEAVKVTSASPAITVTADTSVAHETTYKVGFDGNQAATQIPLTYKQNGGNTRTVKLSDGLNFIDGTNTKARTAADGKVTFDVMGDLTGITSISNAAGGPKMTFGGNSINVTNGDLNMGGNKITNLGKGTATTDAATVGQLTKVTSNNHSVVINKTTDANGAPVYDLAVSGTPGAPAADPRVDMLGEEIGRVGAQGAALSALKPIQYDPLEPTQIMAGYGNYRGNSAVALGVAHYKNESTLIHGGVSWAGGSSHMMANAGVTWKVGNRDSEAAVADRYRKGPISSAYAMQQEMAAMKAQNAGLKGEVSDLKAENEQMKAQIAAMMAKLGL